MKEYQRTTFVSDAQNTLRRYTRVPAMDAEFARGVAPQSLMTGQDVWATYEPGAVSCEVTDALGFDPLELICRRRA